MPPLDRKLVRDLRRLWAQSLAIALVLGAGVAILVIAFGAQVSLFETRAAYYERSRFADVFAAARRAPLPLAEDIAAIAGVQAVEARVAGYAVLDVPGLSEPATGRILSLPSSGEPALNLPILRAGLGMLPGVLELIPAAKVGVVGLQRDETTRQPVGYYEKLTGREFLQFIAEMYGLTRAETAHRIQEVIEIFSLQEFVDDLTERYSHGMRQRTVFAAALVHQPKVLVT